MPTMPRRDLLKLGAVTVPAATWLFQHIAAADDAPQAAQNTPAAPPFDKASICFRIGAPIWTNEARFTELLDLLTANPGVTDEITLFTSETHPPLPLPVILQRLPIAAARMQAARARGYRAGINVLATLGHHEENLANSLSGPTPMTDPNGNICRGSFCPNDPKLHEYITQVYQAVADAKPDYIWIDDDVRLCGHMPILETCFCDNCIALFSKRSGKTFTRDSLRDAMAAGTLEERLALRRAFLQHNRDTLSQLFTLIEKTVHERAPQLPLGFMTGDRFYEGYSFDAWAEVLAGPTHAPVRWRPGGGAYREDRLDDFPDKAHAMGRQVTPLPASITCIQSEIESFPYQRLKKSVHVTSLEAAAYIAAGCTGAAYNVMSQYDEPLGEFAPLVKGLAATRPFLDRLTAAVKRIPPAGLHSGWVKDLSIARNPDGPWFGGWPGAPGHCNELWATGIPAAYHPDHAPVTAFSGDQMLALTDAEIRAAFAKGVLLDGPALQRANDMGYADLTGFAVDNIIHEDGIEELTDHPLNAPFAQRRRNGRQSFWKCPAYLWKPTAANTQTLSRLVDYTYNETHPCLMGIFENALGGRVCVMGYYPWEQLQNLSKSAQLKSVITWLSRDTLPACVASFHRINLWVRETGPDQHSLALLNAYLDPATDIQLNIRTARTTLTLCDARCNETTIPASAQKAPYTQFTIPALQPWEVLLATT